MKNNFKTAEIYFRKSLHIHNAIGNIYFKNKEGSSTSKVLRSLECDTAFIINNMGILYDKRGDKLDAIAMFEKALEIGKSLVEPSSDGKPTSNYVIASSLLHLGNHFMYTMQDIDKAYEYLKESYNAYNLAFQYEFHVDLADVCIGLGRIHLDWKKYRDAKRNFEQARNILMAYCDPMDKRLDLVHKLLHNAAKQLANKYAEEQMEIDAGKLVLTSKEIEQRINEMEHEHNMDRENYAKRKMLEAKRAEMEQKKISL
jgi:tetratricopeptide (TPR) repeat protein